MGCDVADFACAADFLASDDLERTGLLIADQRMPAMTGLELHHQLAASGIVIPTAIMTAYPTEIGREQALRAGVRFFLTKPVSPDDLTACLPGRPLGR